MAFSPEGPIPRDFSSLPLQLRMDVAAFYQKTTHQEITAGKVNDFFQRNRQDIDFWKHIKMDDKQIPQEAIRGNALQDVHAYYEKRNAELMRLIGLIDKDEKIANAIRDRCKDPTDAILKAKVIEDWLKEGNNGRILIEEVYNGYMKGELLHTSSRVLLETCRQIGIPVPDYLSGPIREFKADTIDHLVRGGFVPTDEQLLHLYISNERLLMSFPELRNPPPYINKDMTQAEINQANSRAQAQQAIKISEYIEDNPDEAFNILIELQKEGDAEAVLLLSQIMLRLPSKFKKTDLDQIRAPFLASIGPAHFAPPEPVPAEPPPPYSAEPVGVAAEFSNAIKNCDFPKIFDLIKGGNKLTPENINELRNMNEVLYSGAFGYEQLRYYPDPVDQANAILKFVLENKEKALAVLKEKMELGRKAEIIPSARERNQRNAVALYKLLISLRIPIPADIASAVRPWAERGL